MRRPYLAMVGLAFACNTNVAFDPEGLKCDPGEVCPEGYFCAAGVCRNQVICPNGACACDQVVCRTPPPSQCQDESTLRSFADAGTCSSADGTCSYKPTDSDCPNGCLNGACSGGDPCAGKVCTGVPPPTCLNSSTLRVFTGTCLAGECSYPGTNTACINGCNAGACNNQNLCAGVLCSSPPANVCVGTSLRIFSATGTCDPADGKCNYGSSDSPCPSGCLAGACIGPTLSFTQTGPKVRHGVRAVDQAPGSLGNQVLVVGPGGAVSRWNGTAWTALASGTPAVLNSVWLASATSGWAVGEGKTVLRYNGTGLSPVTLSAGPPGATLVGVHGRGESHVLVVDDSGNYWRFNGTSWSTGSLPSSEGPYVVSGLYVDGADRERIAGKCGNPAKACIAYSSSGNGTFWVDVDSSGSEGFASVGPSVDAASSNFAFAGRDGSASVRRHKTYANPRFDSTSVPGPMLGGKVVGISPASSTTGQAVYLLTARDGAAGQLYRYTSSGSFEPSTPLLDLWGISQAVSRSDSIGVIVADSGASSVSLYRRGVLTNQVLDLGEEWQTAAFDVLGTLHLMNSDGDLASRPSGGALSFRRSPTSSMRAFAVGSTFSLIGGESGIAYKVGTSYSVLTTGTSSALRAICRVSDLEWYLVGDDGVLRTSDGFSVSTLTSPTTEHLRDVLCLGSKQAVAVGAGGTVLRLAGSSWQPSSPAFPSTTATLTSVAESAQGVLYVAGDGVFAKLEQGAWTSLPAKPGLDHLQVFGPSEIYAVAEGNQVVRFDGTSWGTKFTSTETLLTGAMAPGKVVFAGRKGALVEGK